MLGAKHLENWGMVLLVVWVGILWLRCRLRVWVGGVEDGQILLLLSKGSGIKRNGMVSIERLVESVENSVLEVCKHKWYYLGRHMGGRLKNERWVEIRFEQSNESKAAELMWLYWEEVRVARRDE